MFRFAATAVAAALAVAAVLIFVQPDARPPRIPLDSGLSGAEVAERHCQSCHRLPVPGQLPKEAWPFVLDWMGNYLGFAKTYPPFERLADVARIPPRPLVSTREMTRLGRYLIDGAPAASEFRIERAELPPLTGYEAQPVAGIEAGRVVTLVHVDEQRGWVFVGLSDGPALLAFDRRGEKRLEIELASDPVHLEPRDHGFRLTLMGDFDKDKRRAQVIDFALTFEGGERAGDRVVSGVRQRMLVNGFYRCVEAHSVDVDRDGLEDLVLVGFGDGFGPGLGKVSVLWAKVGFEERFAAAPPHIESLFLEGAFEEQVLHDQAGGLGAQVVDIDEDGDLDVLVLATQGVSQVIAFLGDGRRGFERRVLIDEHVSFGFNQFKVLDFDGDGHLDLVTVNGNNMEMPDPPLRPYHGVRIWRGDGLLGFAQAFFHPMYGAMTAVVRDLDDDGDLDIAVNAFYPEWQAREPETFSVLENRGGFEFSARTLGGEHWGRWLRIAAGDVDGDGAVDLVLGSANLPGGGLQPDRPRLYERYRQRLGSATSALVLRRRK